MDKICLLIKEIFLQILIQVLQMGDNTAEASLVVLKKKKFKLKEATKIMTKIKDRKKQGKNNNVLIHILYKSIKYIMNKFP